VDIGRAVRHAVAEGLLVKGGGHAMAAGVTLRKSALAALRAFLESTLAADVEIARRGNSTFQCRLRGEVATHCIKRDSH